VLANIERWEQAFGISVEVLPDNRFMSKPEQFAEWARGRKQLRMEYFYREMRKEYGILMEGDKPLGGQWNYDTENRKPPKEGLKIPTPSSYVPDAITQEVMTSVAKRFGDHFGDLEPFYFAVTREQALDVLQQFITQRLSHFGDYQDAMIEGEPWMYHSHISFYLNCGLLLPLECVQAAEAAYHRGEAPLNAVEGFIRQIIGWREYVRGIYWLNMPNYAEQNFLEATRDLPNFYWTAETKMNCLRQCVLETKQNAYAHHIQRLMVLGNFALISGVEPKQVNAWFLIVYADAYEWVELPNVSGMILFADGGYLASKPYAAGGGYIHKMSDYCQHCSYKVTKKNGPDACPFNYLYWDFLARNREKLASNHRVGMMYKTYDRMDGEKQEAIREDSRRFLEAL
jgi:deoxyribodipyrimidine photolyase-related protein